MWRWISRILLAGCFLAVVWLVVADPTAQGQTPEPYKMALPLLARRAAVTAEPAWRDYVGILTANIDGDMDIYAVRGDGSDWTQLTDNTLYDALPVWSPNGASLVYINSEGTWLMTVATRHTRRLAAWRYTSASWSPNGRYLLFGLSGQRLYLYDREAATMAGGTAGWEWEDAPVWAKNSSGVAWLSAKVGVNSLWVWGVADSVPHSVATGRFHYPLRWSPTGEQLAWIGLEEGEPDIRKLYVATLSLNSVVSTTEASAVLGWVEAGARILILNGSQLYFITPDGMEMEPFGITPVNFFQTLLSPTGTHVLYIANDQQYLHATDQATPTAFDVARCDELGQGCLEYYEWNGDGTRFVHHYETFAQNYSQKVFFVGDATVYPPRYLEGRGRGDVDQFLPFAANLMALSSTSYTYPGPTLYSSYLFNARTNAFVIVPYALNGQVQIIEWRYMP